MVVRSKPSVSHSSLVPTITTAMSAAVAAATARSIRSAGSGERMPSRTAANPLPAIVRHEQLDRHGVRRPCTRWFRWLRCCRTRRTPGCAAAGRRGRRPGRGRSSGPPAVTTIGPVDTTPTWWVPSVSGTNSPVTRTAKARGSTPAGIDPKKRTIELGEASSTTTVAVPRRAVDVLERAGPGRRSADGAGRHGSPG